MKRDLITILTAALWLGCDPDVIDHDDGGNDGGSDPEATFPTRLAEAYCETLFACDPASQCEYNDEPGSLYASQDECVQSERATLEEVSETARNANMTFDAECVDQTIARYQEVGCDGRDRVKLRFNEPYDARGCQPYFGTVPVDENPCFPVVSTSLSNCAANLACYDETCVAQDHLCTDAPCPEGTACDDNAGGGTCMPILAVGDVCVGSDLERTGICPFESYCHTEYDEFGLVSAVCTASVPLGGACIGALQCASLACGDGDVCVPDVPWVCYDDAAPRRWR
jgi:hypothetical protein